ncbi:MAG: hypothetical protein ACT4PJ_03140 [Gemmatimonadaceae bacterium]
MRRLPFVEVVVDAAALSERGGDAIAGPIWLRDCDPDTQADFPEVRWLDRPLTALAAWVSELQRIARTVPAAGTHGACHFVDGPYYFTVIVESDGGWVVRCFEAREESGQAALPVHEWRTGGPAFVASAVRAGRAVLSQCDARGWWSDETEALRRCLESGSQFRRGT